MLIERNVLMGFGVIWNAAPRLPGKPGVAKLFHVAPDSVHGSVTWYRVSGSPWFWMKSTRVALTIVDVAGGCPSPGPAIGGEFARGLPTPPGPAQGSSARNRWAFPEIRVGGPPGGGRASVFPEGPPPPRWEGGKD